MAALTAMASWVGTQLVRSLHDSISRRDAVKISLQTDPGRISAFADLPMQAVVPRSTPQPPSVQGCRGFHAWVHRVRGVDAPATRLQVVVQGVSDKAVLISGMHAEVTRRAPRMNGIPVICQSAGAAQLRSIAIDLDGSSHQAHYVVDGKEQPFAFTVQSGETETFQVVATAWRARYVWVVVIDFVIDGERKTVRVGDRGQLETTAGPRRGWRDWGGDAWGAPR